MINFLLILFAKFLLWFRYRVKVSGIKKIYKKGKKGILFLPNHPALIDPIILYSQLSRRFKPRALADEDQINRFFIRYLVKRFRIITIPDMTKIGASSQNIRKMITECIESLRNGENLILYPAGRTMRGYLEDISGNSAVERIVRELPDMRVVLVRTRGLWGSRFSRASGHEPNVSKILWQGLWFILKNGLFFTPRRHVNIELFEPDDMPRTAGRFVINRYLEDFYNYKAPGNIYVPYTIWEKGKVRQVAEIERPCIKRDYSHVSHAVRKIVTSYLKELTGCENFNDETSLAHDLSMDSLSKMELIVWLQSEFGFLLNDTDSLQTVGDVMLAASGEAVSSAPKKIADIPAKWFEKNRAPEYPLNLTEMKITDAFLSQAQRYPDSAIIADQISGVKTYRDLITNIIILKQKIENFPKTYIGIMLPASVAANIVYLAVLFAGKTPVMVNWTLGRQNLLHCLNSVGIDQILTVGKFTSRIKSQGVDLKVIENRFIYIDLIATGLSLFAKLRGWFFARFSWNELRKAKVPGSAVILNTSGSESVPKTVVLTHKNILTNVYDLRICLTMGINDSVLGILPPFHSFGLTTSMILPLCLGLRSVYYPNPTDGSALGQMIDAYKATILIGTPTFLHGIVRVSDSRQLVSLKLVVTGAEKCTYRIYEDLKERCPKAVIIEGYGVTECSPVISANREDDAHPGTIGRVLPSLEYVIVDPDINRRVKTGEKGLLLVRGPSVFGGYLNSKSLTPFVKFENKKWYNTGDMVIEDQQKILTFSGRLKRFIKLGGEMISLPAIESVIEPHYRSDDHNEGPLIAVAASPEEDHQEIVLVTTADVKRDSVNRLISEAGMSGLHNIRRVVLIDRMPLLGTGKIDYLTLSEILKKKNR